MRTTSPRLKRLAGIRGNHPIASPKSLKLACLLALCTALLAQGFIAGPVATSKAVAAPAAQQGPDVPQPEPQAISNGAAIDLEIQNGPQSFGPGAVGSNSPSNADTPVGESPQPFAPGPDTAFIEAINFNENASLTGFFQIPPDPAGAVGPTHLVNVVNSSIEFYTKSGTRTHRQSLRNFFLAAPAATDPPQTGTFDPKVIYDQYLNRFVVLTMERIEASGATPNQSRVYVAVSDDSDPNGTWFKTTLLTEETIDPDGPGAALPRQSWADFPGLSVDSEAIYFTTNMFAHNNQPGAGSLSGTRLWIIAKAPFYAGSPAVATRYDPVNLAAASPLSDTGLTITTMQPTQMYGDVPGGLGTYLISTVSFTVTKRIQIVRVDNPLAAPTFRGYYSNWGTVAADDNNAGFPGAPQLGTNRLIATNDRRFSQHGIFRNGLLYCASPILPPSGPNANQVTARYYVINPTVVENNDTSNAPPVDQGNIGGEDIAPGTFTFFPAVAVDVLGNLAVGFAASAPSIYPGSYYTGRLATDPAGTTQAARTLRAGQDYYVRAFSASQTVTSRWGDYTGIWLDPLGETNFYVYNEHALPRGTVLASVGPHEDGRWGTAWGAFTLTAAPGVALEGQLIISEFTARGPLGNLDEFIEVFNNTDSPHTVTASDASAGYGIAAEDGVLRCTIPNGTVIPARGHYLCVGAAYGYYNDVAADTGYVPGLPNHGDIGDQQGVALFNTSNPANFNIITRLDAFGYTTSPPIYREGTGFPYVSVANAPRSYVRTQYNGFESDTDNNASDFISVNARLDICCDPKAVLGMAGPQNLASPINRSGQTPMTLFDPGASSTAPANRERNSTVVPNGQFGTLRFRRTITNNTGQTVTRMRIRVVDITTLQSPTAPEPGRPTPCPAPCGDLRVLSSSDEAAIATTSGPKPTSGTTLELAAYQPLGGGYNSSLNVNQVTNMTPVAPGDSINVNILLGVMRTGNVRFFVTVEVLP